MLRRVNAALFEAPPGARIQVVADAQNNNGVNAARFEYATQILPVETILGLPGCSFTVGGPGQRLEAAVVFDPGAPGAARYDLFEVENGVKSNLKKFVKNSDGSVLIGFAIDPVLVEADPAMADAPPVVASAEMARKPAAKAAAKKATKKKRPTRSKTATAASRKTAKKKTRTTTRKRKTTKKTTTKKKKSAKKTVARRRTTARRTASRKSPR